MLTWKAVASSGCRLAAFFFLRAGPATVAVNADSQGSSFDWCVFVWFVFGILARDSLAGGCARGPGTTADADVEGSCLKQPRSSCFLLFVHRPSGQRRCGPVEPAQIFKEDFSVIAAHACQKMHVQGSCFGAEKPCGIGARS